MSDNIEIQVTDKASQQADKISASFINLASASDKAGPAVARLKNELNSVGANSSLGKLTAELNKIIPALTRLETAMSKSTMQAARLAVANQKLATEQARTAAATARAAAAESSAAAAASRAEAAALRLAAAQNRVTQSNQQQTASFTPLIRQLAGFIGVIGSARAVLTAADAYTTLQNKLQNVATSMSQVNELTERLFDLANKTRTPVEETATAFTRFDRALKYMGKSQEEALRMTETINKALVVSGATAQESASALLQLSQAFNAGKLQGDEFRSISENMPMVLDAVAKALNKPIAAVKQLSTDGKITAEVLYKAFQIMQQQVDATFGKTVPTVAQSMAVLKNNWTQFVGELNKSYGITASISASILSLSRNLDSVAAGAAIAGVAMITYFGPTLVSMFTAATAAVTRFTLALARNPIGLLAVALSALIATVVFAGDKIRVFGDSFLTLKDYAVGAINVISDALSALGDVIGPYLSPLIEGLGPMFSSAFDTIVSDLKTLGLNTKDEINTIIGLFDNAQENIKNLWSALPTILMNLIKTAANGIVSTIQTMINAIASGINSLFTLANKASAAVGGSQIFNTDLKVDLSNYLSEIEPITQKFGNTAGKDYVGAFFDSVKNNAQKRGVDRLMSDLVGGGGPSTLRGSGPNTSGASDVGKKDKTKKTPLTELQKAQNSILRDIIKTYQGYELTLNAANGLLAKGAITQEQYNKVVLKAKEEYLNTIDPMRQINKQLDQQQKLTTESASTRAASTQLQQIENQLLAEGVVLNDKQTQALRAKIQAQEDAKISQAAMDDISSKGYEGFRQLTLQAQGYGQALVNGAISQDQFTNSMNRLGVQAATLKVQLGEGSFTDMLTSSLGQLTTNFDGVMSGLTTSMGTFFESFTTGFANAISGAIMGTESFGDALRNVAQSAIGALISSLIQLGIQWAVNAALGTALQTSSLAAQTAASAAAASAMAVAWAPAASLASLASFGANSVPATAGMVQTFAVGQTMAAAGALGGFQTGGYTGSAGVSQVAGVVHGQEYVFDAAATKRIGVNNLEAMRRGGQSVSSNSSSVGSGNSSGINIEFVNNGTPQNYQVEQLDEGRVRIIAEDVVKAKAGETVANDFNNPNSKASKGITNNFDANRKR